MSAAGNVAIAQASMPNQLGLGQGILPGSGVSGLGVQQAQSTIASRYKYVRERVIARTKVLEYIETQLNMDLFKGDAFASAYFEEAMQAALEKLK